MTKRLRTIPIAIAASLALLVLPASALAEYLVPEGNSAVTQYTEGFPTGGGEKKTGSNGKKVTPAKTIGAANAKKLEDHGSEGAEVAEVAAETAPEVEAETPASSGRQQSQHEARSANDEDKQQKQETGKGGLDEATIVTPAPSQDGDGPGGSSGTGEVLGTATGLSSGSLGLLLPLVILAAIAWGIAHLLRQRKRPESAAAES